MWVSACYTKKTKEIQRSRRERARSENERRLHRSTTTTTTTEGETDGRASSSSPPFPHHLSKAPFNLFSADDAHSAHHHGHSPRTQPPTTPDRREKTPFFLAFHAHPTPRLARVHSPGPRFRECEYECVSQVVGNSAHANKIS